MFETTEEYIKFRETKVQEALSTNSPEPLKQLFLQYRAIPEIWKFRTVVDHTIPINGHRPRFTYEAYDGHGNNYLLRYDGIWEAPTWHGPYA